MNRVLITGGLGFIGSNFIQYASKTWKFREIVNLDSVSYGAVPQNLRDLESMPGYRFMKGDITNSKLVEELLGDCEVLVHFAAETHVDRSIRNPQAFFHSNVLGTFTLLEAARRSDLSKFVHVSTDEVYGSAPGRGSFNEEDRLLASSPYAASKAAADMFVEAYHKTYGLNTVILRCTNNFGPRQFPEKFIPKSIICAILGRKIPIYGDGMQVRDWIYVLDFCKAIDLATQRGEVGVIYNVSAGNELPNVEVAKRILTIIGKGDDLLDFVDDRPGHDVRYSLDSSRIRGQMGWRADHPFQEALKETVQWYRENESWWRPLINDKILSSTPWKETW